MSGTGWSASELRRELARFERELRASDLAASSVANYIDATAVFLRWLEGDYVPGQGLHPRKSRS